MKIFTIDQIREADRYTIENEPITSLMLMERAATNVYQRISELIDSDSVIHILCGPGNNGGDGLVIARLLAKDGFRPTVWLAFNGIQPSEDNRANLALVRDCQEIRMIELNDVSNFKIQEQNGVVIIDALFGSGLNRPLTGFWTDFISEINLIKALKIAIDIPSGLFADRLNDPEDSIFRSDYTLSIEFPKLSFFYIENAATIGNMEIIPIGLHPDFTLRTETKNNYTTFKNAQQILKSRSRISHKGNYGHALMITGSYGMMGASVLSAKSCLRSGVGLLTVHIPKCGYTILQSAIPEAMASVDAGETCFTGFNSKQLTRYQAIGIGCGLSTEDEAAKGLKELIFNAKIPMVVDADALNILAENPTWLPFVPPYSIFTPHIKEFERLTERAENSEHRLQIAREFAIKNRIVLILKGANSAIISPTGEVYFNSTGNPGMATGGCGDVLTGIITGLLAQGYSPTVSAVLGVYVHGLAADLAIDDSQSVESLIASDIIEYLGSAFHLLRSNN
jgi:ADP-dependent NAD(P)H-hydrate dehydratase / NAD(P)H-hydrate epimerase